MTLTYYHHVKLVAMEEEEKEIVDIITALKQSIEQARDKKKSMARSRTRTKSMSNSA